MYKYANKERILTGYKKITYSDHEIKNSLLEKIFKSLERFFNNLSYKVYKLNKLVNRKEVEKQKEVPIYEYVEIKVSNYDYLIA